MSGWRIPRAGLFAILLSSTLGAQEDGKESLVTLPPLPVFKLSSESYYVLHGKVTPSQADFIRRLRRVPAAPSLGEPDSLIIETYLKRKSKAYATKDAYIESDWIGVEDLAVMAALVPKAALLVDELFGVPERHAMKSVLMKTKEDYYALTDAWAEEEGLKRLARSVSGLWVKGHRDAFVTDLSGAYSLVMADTLRSHFPESFRAQTALTEGLHSYLTVMAVGDYQIYIAVDTTPRARGREKVLALYEVAREVLSRPKHEGLEVILRSELNGIVFERLAVLFAFMDFLLQKKREVWKTFVETLDRESREDGKLKGPEARFEALKKAIEDSVGLDLKGLEEELRKWTASNYLFPEELAHQVGLDRECAESTFEGFATVCRLKREGKPVSEKGERIHAELLKRLEKKLEREKF